ncbi:SMC-Scp complex subunit ScpB [Desulfuribacillus stibiiarsenatis]|uniref:Segregation and condensation protein B n=1 Tax=Desulfuribacillus stibiiarsenatis TaxID=1390249 RepID=A0A1E5L6H5_9FIRM|nr:SMC-Scp complex subunit ScpB [Desulfuribacillus stibiiarsenatis]OEH85716.1 SMC-Scp complex subunit ScpB [Desulfuribacillus stibiiarsenatis]
MDDIEKKRVIEGALYLFGEDGLSLKQICSLLDTDEDDALDLVLDLQQDFIRDSRGLQIIEIADSFSLVTCIEHAPYYEKLAKENQQTALSQAAIEVLSIIAYKQPMTRAEVEEIRGVKSEKAINSLLQRNLIEEAGRKEGLGRARLYKTTRDFLDCFGLRDITELPSIPELTLEEEEQIRNLFQEERE